MSIIDQHARVGYISARGHVVPEHGDYLPLQNPATGAGTGEVFEMDAATLDEVVVQARTTYEQTWRRTAPDVRGAMLARWADLIEQRREELADLEVSDVGHLRREALGDIDTGTRLIRYYAGMADKIEGKTYSQFPDRIAYGVGEPFGVVGAITPFNANAVMVGLKAAPALVAGNCMVLKAPESAPLLVLSLIELALEAGIPPGVLSAFTGRGHVVGPMLMENKGVGMLSFTGSVEAGRAVIRQSADRIIPLVLELGGKSPIILLPDAKLDFAIPSAVHSNFVKSGQSCVAGSRILVHSSIYDEVAARVAELAGRIRVGLPTEPTSQMSTLISTRQRESVDALVTSAVAAGATRLAGGAAADWDPLGGGAFYQPTVLADVTDDNPAARTEAFGPMASLLRFDTVDEALARANDSEFGLSAQVWGNDAGAIQHLAQNLEAGAVWVNTYRAAHPTLPLAGMKTSGYGQEYGFEAVLAYTRPKSVMWDLTTERVLPYQD
ncbi:aldehyde dehydrogenase [Marmoricola sp. Leaf446]|uniref:aldehyde dehydrogenase family protein n=1 Tax=Marmoricola sp. Leaf446 TaxID=1736379 RepID=UPI0006FD46FF|nr:aldehyde dehydrogenase family protein [Marmoricola sp. Leaf446]KQT93484.1 aldehyde dehydrogenase [Marmoricola sp. Leaf446]